MGGPSRRSHLAAQVRERRRLAALRTRHGVVDLAEWRKARRAAAALEGLLHEPPWLLEVRLVPAATAGLELRVVLLRDSPAARLSLPRSIDDVPVRIVVRNPDPGRGHRAR